MKRISKSRPVACILGVGLLALTACAPDLPTRGGAAQPIPVERVNENSAATNANEAVAPAAPAGNSSSQPAASASGLTLTSPLATPTAEPMPEPQNEIEFTGAVEVMASDMWVVDGRTIAVTAATEIKPGLTVGTQAKVHAVQQADGTLWAREIEPVSGNDNNNGNSNDNGNGNSNSNDDNGNGNINSNDDNGNGNSNDDNGNSNVNSNDDNGNDDHGGNSNDDHGGNGNDDHGGNSNDDHGGNSNDDHGGNGNDDHGGNSNDDNSNSD